MHQCKKIPFTVSMDSFCQLAIGKNPQSRSTLNEKVSALTSQPVNKIVSSKNFEKIIHVLSHNIRTSGYIKYITGDSNISAWEVQNDMNQPKTTNKCFSKTEAPILGYNLVTCNSLTKTGKTTKMH